MPSYPLTGSSAPRQRRYGACGCRRWALVASPLPGLPGMGAARLYLLTLLKPPRCRADRLSTGWQPLESCTAARHRREAARPSVSPWVTPVCRAYNVRLHSSGKGEAGAFIKGGRLGSCWLLGTGLHIVCGGERGKGPAQGAGAESAAADPSRRAHASRFRHMQAGACRVVRAIARTREEAAAPRNSLSPLWAIRDGRGRGRGSQAQGLESRAMIAVARDQGTCAAQTQGRSQPETGGG